MDTKMTIWSGYTKYWDEILDAFSCQGIKYEADKNKRIIKVEKKTI